MYFSKLAVMKINVKYHIAKPKQYTKCCLMMNMMFLNITSK